MTRVRIRGTCIPPLIYPLDVVSGVSVDELGSEGNERASEMSDLTDLLCESTFRSMNHVRCQVSVCHVYNYTVHVVHFIVLCCVHAAREVLAGLV